MTLYPRDSGPGGLLVSFALHPQSVCFPWVYSACFHSLRPAPSIFPGLIRLLYLSMPRSPDLSGAYLVSFPLCARPSIDPGLIQLLYLSTPRSLNRPGAYSASLPLYAPLPQSTQGLFGFFSSLRPALPIGPGLNQLLWFSAPRSLDLPGAYLASFPLCAPLSRSPRGLFGFFASLCPALPIFPGLIWLLCLSTPRPPDLPGA